MSNIREQFLQANTLKTETVDAAGMTIRIRELTGKQRAEIADLFFSAREPDPNSPGDYIQKMPPLYRENVIIRGCVNDDGTLLFRPEDAASIANVHSERVINELCEAINDLSQIDADDIEEEAGN